MWKAVKEEGRLEDSRVNLGEAVDEGGWGQAPSSYYESNFVSRHWRNALASMVRTLLPLGWESAKLLDLGTGDGYTIRLVKPEGEVVGVDSDASMETPATNRGVTFRLGSAYNLPFPDESFDLAACIEVVEHLSRPEAAIDELRRVLRKGGFAVISTPVPKVSWRLLWWSWTKIGPGKRWESSPHVTDLYMWDKGNSEGLATLLERKGFEIEDTRTCNLGYIAGVRAKKL